MVVLSGQGGVGNSSSCTDQFKRVCTCLLATTHQQRSCKVEGKHPLLSCQLNAGIGGVTALKLIQKHGSLEAVMAQLDTSRYGIPDPFPFQEARGLFKGTAC